MGSFDGQVALVTGGVRGIGLAISERLIEGGAVVAAGYSRDQVSADRFAEVHAARRCSVHLGNIASATDCERVVAEVLARHGRVDVLVNNAGIALDHTVRRMSHAEWDRVLQVNLSGAFYMSKAVLPHMVERGYGRVVNISSIIGERGNVGQANYAAAKSGLFGLTISLALETARHGITVNCVAPGFVATEMVEAMPPDALAKVIEQVPVGRLGRPEEVARVVEFLTHPDSAYITGQVYSVNGGLYM